MEKIIVNPIIGKDAMLSSDVSLNLEDKGIILVYDEKDIIGSVILNDNEFILSTIILQETYPYLNQIISNYPQYTFKYIS